MGNTFGRLFAVTTFGESHGLALGAVIDGCPSRLKLAESDIQVQLDRRRPGQSRLTSQRREDDIVRIVAGVENGMTLGSPIALLIDNKDARPEDYESTTTVPRPSHADFVYKQKYGVLSFSGGGRASARETVCRVAAGAVAEKFLRECHDVSITAWVSSVGDIEAPDMTETPLERRRIDESPVQCPDPASSDRMAALIEEVSDKGDSIGGTVTCVCRNAPAGWGEPVFDKMSAALAAAMMSVPAAKGFEIGSGFASTRMRGSEHNDMFAAKERRIGTATNRSGGIQGGITNGEPVVFRVAFKPPATIKTAQATVDYEGTPVTLKLDGRHDPCVVARAVPIVEAMAALVLADMALLAAAVR